MKNYETQTRQPNFRSKISSFQILAALAATLALLAPREAEALHGCQTATGASFECCEDCETSSVADCYAASAAMAAPSSCFYGPLICEQFKADRDNDCDFSRIGDRHPPRTGAAHAAFQNQVGLVQSDFRNASQLAKRQRHPRTRRALSLGLVSLLGQDAWASQSKVSRTRGKVFSGAGAVSA